MLLFTQDAIKRGTIRHPNSLSPCINCVQRSHAEKRLLLQRCEPPWQDKCQNWVPILLIFRYSVLSWFSV